MEKTQRKACHVKMEAEIEVTCLWAKVCWQPCEAGSKAWNRPPQSPHREPTPPTPGFWESWTPAQGANPFLLFSASFLVAATGNGQQAEDKATDLASGANMVGGSQGPTYPITNFILPFLAASMRMGTNWGSLGPKMPWGRMAVVRKFFSGSWAPRTACRRAKGGCGLQILKNSRLLLCPFLHPNTYIWRHRTESWVKASKIQ